MLVSRTTYKFFTGVRRLHTLDYAVQKREGFGSFHSSDIEEIIRQPESVYSEPYIWKEVVDNILNREKENIEGIVYGSSYCKQHFFAINNKWTFLNHGAFGATLNVLLEEANVWRYNCESQPLMFFDRHLLPMLAFSVRNMAQFLNCPAEELLPMQNVTSGLNCAIHSTPATIGDDVICLSITYGSTKKILMDFAVTSGASFRTLEVSLPIQSEDEFCEQIISAITTKSKLIVLDQITSNTALRLPVLRIAKEIRARFPEIVIIVDAAHALLADEVDIYPRPQPPLESSLSSSPTTTEGTCTSLDPSCSIADVADYWMTNGHKWLCAPKGCAFMWVSDRARTQLRPAIVSHGFSSPSNPNKLLSAFAWDGCRDYAALLCCPSATRFWRHVPGGERGARRYARGVLEEAVAMLRDRWDIRHDDVVAPASMRARCMMALVPLPRMVAGVVTQSHCTDVDAFRLQERLHHEYRVEVPVKCLQGRLYVRISAHVYNCASDYEHLADVVARM